MSINNPESIHFKTSTEPDLLISLDFEHGSLQHEAVRNLFATQLSARRENHPNENSWVIPFHYDLEEADDINIFGGLWIPPDHIQDIINEFGSYVHMSATYAMESDLYKIGINASQTRCNSIMDLSGEVPVVYAPSYMAILALRREQVERDYGVTIEFE